MISNVPDWLLAHGKKNQFQTLSVIHNGSKAFRFVQLAVLPFLLCCVFTGRHFDK